MRIDIRILQELYLDELRKLKANKFYVPEFGLMKDREHLDLLAHLYRKEEIEGACHHEGRKIEPRLHPDQAGQFVEEYERLIYEERQRVDSDYSKQLEEARSGLTNAFAERAQFLLAKRKTNFLERKLYDAGVSIWLVCADENKDKAIFLSRDGTILTECMF